jgi:hypothetical protein
MTEWELLMGSINRGAAVAGLAAGLSEGVRLSGWRATLRLRVEASASPAALAGLVRAVEREPEFVPGVRQVTVFARGVRQPSALSADDTDTGAVSVNLPGGESRFYDGWVHYQVRGSHFGLPWAVRFHKVWEGDTRFLWWSEGGTGWAEHDGSLTLIGHGSGTRLELWAETRSGLPLLGGLGTLLVNPLFLAPAFRGWLENLARAAERDADCW